MKQAFRLMMLTLVTVAAHGAWREPVEARRNLCYVQERWYYADSSCTGDPVGYTNFDCNGSSAGGWGSQTSQFSYFKEGGSVCNCSGGDWTDSGSVGCSR